MKLEDNAFYYNRRRFRLPIRRPTVTEVQAFADSLGVTFPEEYVSLIVKRAGRVLRGNFGYAAIEEALDGTFHPMWNEIGIFLHYDIERDTGYAIQMHLHEFRSENHYPPFLPFCTSGVSEPFEICFDFRQSTTQPVIVEVDRRNRSQDNPEEPLSVPVADSFSEFLERIIPLEYFHEEIAPKIDIHGTVHGNIGPELHIRHFIIGRVSDSDW